MRDGETSDSESSNGCDLTVLYESSKGDFWFFSKFENNEKIEKMSKT